MALVAGTRFGSYEVTEQIGVGGMGEVYRAIDTKLKRSVAVKTLPESFATDADRLARFQREAEILASLNHPNIAQIFGLEETQGATVLVMELVEGPTLADRIAKGPLRPDDALGIASQIADALAAAHERHVVHRDLKPANIKLKPDGTVKVLDFGIAKPVDAEAISGGRSPVMTTPAVTETGVIIGTAAYMSPEQARGKPVDQRTDIWAFGCLLFEMLTGQPAFGGEDVMATLARVIDRDTDLSSMPGTISPAVRHTISLCLEKDPDKRIADIRDVRLALGGAFEMPLPRAAASTAGQASWRRALPIAAAVLGTGLVLGVAGWMLWPSAPPVTRFAYDLPAVPVISRPERSPIAVSPDGRQFVYGSDDGLHLRALDELEARLIPGSEPLSATPAFSPDGQSIAYTVLSTQGQVFLKRISVNGGAPTTITEIAGLPFNIDWESDGSIFFNADGGIFRISENGGAAELIVQSDGAVQHSPELLPDGHTLLFTSATSGAPGGQIMAQSLSTGERSVLISAGSDAHYLPTGHLVYVVGDTLYAVAFDARNLSVSDNAVPLIQGIKRTSSLLSSIYSVADSGTLIYLMGETLTPGQTLTWVDRQGREQEIDAPARNYASAQLSPDGTRIALGLNEQENDIWIWNLERRTLQRLTFDPGLNRAPVWSPDGSRVAFTRSNGSTEAVYWQAADGSGAPEPLIDVEGMQFIASDFLPDGSALIYTEAPPRDINVVPTDDPNAGRVLLQTASIETNATISPDGNWIAYQSDESGQIEVYVRPYPDVDSSRSQISTEGGTRPHWSRDGTELFYFVAHGGGTNALMAVPIDAGPPFRAGAPELLFEGPYMAPNPGRQIYDVSPDGQRFLMIKPTPEVTSERPRIVVVQNWFEELKRLGPSAQ